MQTMKKFESKLKNKQSSQEQMQNDSEAVEKKLHEAENDLRKSKLENRTKEFELKKLSLYQSNLTTKIEILEKSDAAKSNNLSLLFLEEAKQKYLKSEADYLMIQLKELEVLWLFTTLDQQHTYQVQQRIQE